MTKLPVKWICDGFCVVLQVNMLGNHNQNFLPQNPVPFGQQSQYLIPPPQTTQPLWGSNLLVVCPPPASQAAPENHFGQVDVNDLLTKLISNGIIKPSQPDATPTPAGQLTASLNARCHAAATVK